jgi:hypothetical protein
MRKTFILVILPLLLAGSIAFNDEKALSKEKTELEPFGEIFLLGDWVSADKSDFYCESWKKSAGDTIYGVQTEGERDGFKLPTLCVILFNNTPWGQTVSMRRLTSRAEDISTSSRIVGSWKQAASNRGKFHLTDSQRFWTTIDYDSPSPNLLNVTVTTTSDKRRTVKTHHLQRQR